MWLFFFSFQEFLQTASAVLDEKNDMEWKNTIRVNVESLSLKLV